MCIGEQSKGFILDYAVAFARAGLQPVSVDHRDMAAAVTDQSFMLQFAGFFRDTFAAHTEHADDLFMCDGHPFEGNRSRIDSSQRHTC